MQPGIAQRPHAVRGPKKVRVTESQLGRHHALGDQASADRTDRASSALSSCARCLSARLQFAPLAPVDQQRQRIELPWPIAPLRIGVDVVGDAVFDDQPPRQLDAAARRFGAAASTGARSAGSSASESSRRARAVRHNAARCRDRGAGLYPSASARDWRPYLTLAGAAKIQGEREVRIRRLGARRASTRCWPGCVPYGRNATGAGSRLRTSSPGTARNCRPPG